MTLPLRPALLLAVAAALAAGCTAGPGHGGHGGSDHATAPAAAPAPAYTVYELAAALGCQPTNTLTGADYRQATCTAAGTRLVLLDFATTEGQRAWLDGAVMYGGAYLVGTRWTLSGNSKQYLETLQPTLGGTIQLGLEH